MKENGDLNSFPQMTIATEEVEGQKELPRCSIQRCKLCGFVIAVIVLATALAALLAYYFILKDQEKVEAEEPEILHLVGGGDLTTPSITLPTTAVKTTAASALTTRRSLFSSTTTISTNTSLSSPAATTSTNTSLSFPAATTSTTTPHSSPAATTSTSAPTTSGASNVTFYSGGTRCGCQPLQITFCSQLTGFSDICFPNFYNEYTQKDAILSMSRIIALARICGGRTAEHLTCFLFVPRCENNQQYVPCRETCQAVEAACGGLLRGFGHKWPVDCEKQLPRQVDSPWCSQAPNLDVLKHTSTSQRSTTPNITTLSTPTSTSTYSSSSAASNPAPT